MKRKIEEFQIVPNLQDNHVFIKNYDVPVPTTTRSDELSRSENSFLELEDNQFGLGNCISVFF